MALVVVRDGRPRASAIIPHASRILIPCPALAGVQSLCKTRRHAMRAAVLYGPRDVRFEDRETPRIEQPTDAVISMPATCVSGSDLWPYRGLNPIKGPQPMGHEYCGVVEEVGSAVKNVRPGQFVVGSFATSDNTCPNCQYGYQSSCVHDFGAVDAKLVKTGAVVRGCP